jgi:hypothetical protein
MISCPAVDWSKRSQFLQLCTSPTSVLKLSDPLRSSSSATDINSHHRSDSRVDIIIISQWHCVQHVYLDYGQHIIQHIHLGTNLAVYICACMERSSASPTTIHTNNYLVRNAQYIALISGRTGSDWVGLGRTAGIGRLLPIWYHVILVSLAVIMSGRQSWRACVQQCVQLHGAENR